MATRNMKYVATKPPAGTALEECYIEGLPSGGDPYELPTADVSTLGGVKVSVENLGAMNQVDTYINGGVIKGRVPSASADTPGLVKQAAHVSGAAGETVTKAEFQALLDALTSAGILAAS